MSQVQEELVCLAKTHQRALKKERSACLIIVCESLLVNYVSLPGVCGMRKNLNSYIL